MRKITVRRATRALATTAIFTFLLAAPAQAAGVPNPTPGLPGGLDAKLTTLLGMFMAIVIVACVGGVFLAAWKLAVAYRHGEFGEAAGKLGAVGGACILVGSASAIVTFLYA